MEGKKMLEYFFLAVFLILSWSTSQVNAINIDITDAASIKHAAFVFSHGVMSYYNGNTSGGTIGKFVSPYYWWQAGAAWGSILDYYVYTGDETYNKQLSEAVLANVGPSWNFMPTTETTTEGNDDQAFWGFVSMAAAERNFTNPPSDKPQWLALSQAVFDSMIARWDNSTCGGGLRWQIFELNNGYNYKNTVSNGGLFLLAARLARYTGDANSTYGDWAEKVWDWVVDTNLLDLENYYVYDGMTVTDCTDIVGYQWTYNAAMFLAGSAYMYNHTEDSIWQQRIEGLMSSLDIFFSNGVMTEVACERNNQCNTDERSFKAYFARFMGLTAILAPFTYDRLMGYLQTTVTNGLAQSCVGGSDGVTCGTTWLVQGWDGTWGLGQEMSALEVVQNLLVSQVPAPYTQGAGGSSPNKTASDNGGRYGGDGGGAVVATTGGRVAAGFLTAGILMLLVSFTWFMLQ
ncbi:glycosyl hydrolase family 76-domain-containing protein [Limtongia smithiae]|uniref:glycosyl hydrolase family 76-domain-containing protein n=1 Tax=Limtongia smithiae TaxID=1125753 RepID=UPI0034CF8163